MFVILALSLEPTMPNTGYSSAFHQDQLEATKSCSNDFEGYGGDIYVAGYSPPELGATEG